MTTTPNDTPTPETDVDVICEYIDKLASECKLNPTAYQIEAKRKARQLERELAVAKENEDEGWKEAERLRVLVPTTAQSMAYQDLLVKFEAMERRATTAEQRVKALDIYRVALQTIKKLRVVYDKDGNEKHRTLAVEALADGGMFEMGFCQAITD